jgi:Fur family transcriptional regulator, ferric uptake regulator
MREVIFLQEARGFKELLKKENIKNTKHRNSVLEVMQQNNQPITVEEIYFKLQENGVSISLSTVYRVLEVLWDKDIVLKMSFADNNKALYEINNKKHRHHVLCLKCRKMLPVEGCPIGEFVKSIEQKFQFTISGHNLEFYGVCNHCHSN